MEIQEKRLWQVINLQCISLEKFRKTEKSVFVLMQNYKKNIFRYAIQIISKYIEVGCGTMKHRIISETVWTKQLPKKFSGHALSIGDVLILDKNGEAAAYYLEKEGFTVLDDFIRNGSSNTLISLATTNFQLEGKEGSWLAFDNLVVEGKEFFLMEHTTYGKNAAWVVVDGTGKLIVDQVTAGFDETVKEQIVSYLHPQETQGKKWKTCFGKLAESL